MLSTLYVNDTSSNDDCKVQKDGLRELGSILEQLLVIDHENEKLLRKLLSVKPSRATNTRTLAPTNSARPALQTQLPFFPGGAQRTATPSRGMVASGTPTRSSNRLKKYGATSRTTTESKYA